MVKLFNPVVSEAAIESVVNVLRSGWIGEGPVTAQFEKEFAEYIGCKYAISTNSATSALHLAVKTLNLRPGDEVITTPMTFISTNHVLLYENLIPVFCDIDEDTLNMDVNKIEALITEKTRALMVVHYAGNPVDLDRVYSIASSYNLKVIEDAAHACGSEYNGRKIGSYGLTCFSFHAVKNLPAGDGGMITTDDEELYRRLHNLRWMGIDKSTFDRTSSYHYSWNYNLDEIGYKYHMNDITASIALANLKNLDLHNSLREYMVSYYRTHLNIKVGTLTPTPNSKSSNHLFVIKIPERNKLHHALAGAGISSGVHYRPNHLYPMYGKFFCNLPVTEAVYQEILSLPLHVKLTESDLDLVCSEVNALCR